MSSNPIIGAPPKDQFYNRQSVQAGSFQALTVGNLDASIAAVDNLTVNNLVVLDSCDGCSNLLLSRTRYGAPGDEFTWINTPDANDPLLPTVQLNPLATDYNVSSTLIFPANSSQGTGTRLTFDATSGAFRAGTVNGDKWDSVGNNSVAFGLENSVPTGSVNSSILGGQLNTIANFTNSTIAGGSSNTMTGAAAKDSSFIGAGFTNTIAGEQSGIVCGALNFTAGDNSVICGGTDNFVYGNSSGVVCGHSNIVGADVTDSAVLCGYQNSITGTVSASAIVAGFDNVVYANNSCIVAGNSNTIESSATNSSILSGSKITATFGDMAYMTNAAHLGGTVQKIRNISSSTDVQITDFILLADSTAGNCTLTLTSTISGQEYIVKKVVTANNVIIDAGVGNTIIPVNAGDGARTYTLPAASRAAVHFVLSSAQGITPYVWNVIMSVTGT